MALGFRKQIPISTSSPVDLDIVALQSQIDKQTKTLDDLRAAGHVTTDTARQLAILKGRMVGLQRDRRECAHAR